MAEYWVSQPKKFCEFCKCWITDNKASIEFHERGVKHKKCVEERIREARHRSTEKKNAEKDLQAELQAIEKAAAAAFREDIKSNPALARELPSKGAYKKSQLKPQENYKVQPVQTVPHSQCSWTAQLSPEGYTYYYNWTTGESKWEKPAGFIQNQSNSSKVENASKTADSNSPAQSKIDKDNENGMTETGIKRKIDKVDSGNKAVGTANASPYGAWVTVAVHDVVEKKVESKPEPKKELVPAEEEIAFRQKTIDSFSSSLQTNDSGVAKFKKRSIKFGLKKNIRQRDDE